MHFLSLENVSVNLKHGVDFNLIDFDACNINSLLYNWLYHLAVNRIMSLAIIDQLIYLLHADFNTVAQRKTNYCICIAAFYGWLNLVLFMLSRSISSNRCWYSCNSFLWNSLKYWITNWLHLTINCELHLIISAIYYFSNLKKLYG